MPGLDPEMVRAGGMWSVCLPSHTQPPCPGSASAPPGEAAQEQEKGRAVLLDQMDLKAPEDWPKHYQFKPPIYVWSNTAGGHASTPASGLGLQWGLIF